MALSSIVQDVIDGESLAVEDASVTFTADVPTGLMVRADSEQLYRVLSNLIRNARQAIVAAKRDDGSLGLFLVDPSAAGVTVTRHTALDLHNAATVEARPASVM